MENKVILDGREYPIKELELHLPLLEETRFMYLGIQCTSEGGGFGLWDIELSCLKDIDDLDGKRIHVKPSGETYEDDTLGTDIIGAVTDLNYWHTSGDGYSYGDILVDFTQIEGPTYKVHIEMSLTESDEEPEDLSPEDYNIHAHADFEVTVDEENPMD